jgi:5'-nucleotidase
LSARSGQHVDADSITINGRRLSPTDRIRAAAPDFLIDGGGPAVFSEGTERVVGIAEVEALVDYFKTHSPIAPGPQNRMVRTD